MSSSIIRKLLNPLPSAAVAGDRTDPLAGTAVVEERASLLWRDGDASMEQVEVWGNGQCSDAFLRLTLAPADARAEVLRSLLLELPERNTGFRDLLIHPESALAASFILPDACLSQLAVDGPGVGRLLRPRHLLRGLGEVARFLAMLETQSGLGWPHPSALQLGLRSSQPFKAPGHHNWDFQFTGWTQLQAGSTTPAGQLAALLLPAFDWLAAAPGNCAGFCAEELARLRSELEALSTQEGLLLEELSRSLQELETTSWRMTGLSDVGRRRDHNEDAFLLLELQQFSAYGSCLSIAAVADGMGGHNSGEIASSLALDLLRTQLQQLALPPRSRSVNTAGLENDLRTAVQGSGRALLDRAALDPALSGMGTTLCGMVTLSGHSSVDTEQSAHCCVFNIGDSRVYLLGPHGISRLTTDHSHVQELVDSGQLAADDAFTHPQKNVITRCLGGGGFSEPDPDIYAFTPGPAELLLVCSDGLSDALRDSEILATAAAVEYGAGGSAYLQRLARALVEAANRAGGPDNITVLLAAAQPSSA